MGYGINELRLFPLICWELLEPLCLFNSDVEDIPSFGDSTLKAYREALSLAETPEEIKFFNDYRDKIKASFPELQ